MAEAILAAVAKIDTLGKPTELTLDDEAEVLDARALADKALILVQKKPISSTMTFCYLQKSNRRSQKSSE